jgi:polysaccharide biosynthesis/export protein
MVRPVEAVCITKLSLGNFLSRTGMVMLGMVKHGKTQRMRMRRVHLFGLGMFLAASLGTYTLEAQTSTTGNAAANASSAPQSSGSQDTASSAAKAHDDTYVIGNDDVLSINVWKEPDISRSIPVRSDGKISLPLVGEVQATGQTPMKLEKEIAAKLQNYISDPEVSVMVQQSNSQKFNILGQVVKPGTYAIANSPTVLDAIALAGGFRDFAKQKSIYVLRQSFDGKEVRLPFNYKDVIKGKNLDQNVKIQPRDTIVVP